MQRSISARPGARTRRPLALFTSLAIVTAALTAVGTSAAFADGQPGDPTDPGTGTQPASGTPVTISDPALATCTDERLDLAAGNTTFDSDALASLTSLACAHVADASDLTYYTGLTTLDLSGGTITDVTPLAGLTNLATLNLDANHVTDLSSLSPLLATSTSTTPATPRTATAISALGEVLTSSAALTVGSLFDVPPVRSIGGTPVAVTSTSGVTLNAAKTTATPTATSGSIGWGAATGSTFTVGYSFTAAPGTLVGAVPKISGTAATFHRLVATAGSWNPTGAKLTYRWLQDGKPIAGATSSTYLLGVRQLHHSITVAVTGTKAGYTPQTLVSSAKTIRAASFTSAPTPSIHGKAATGSTLTVVHGKWAPATVTLHYRWKLAGKSIAGATHSTYTPTASQVHKKISVTVTGSKTGYATATRTSKSVVSALGTIKSAPAPKVSGSATAGSKLTATVSGWSSGAKITTHWRKNGSNISGATARSYTVRSGDKGATISVVATGSKAGYKSVAKVSAGRAIAKPAPAPAPAPAASATCLKGTYVNSQGHTICRPEPSATVPAGATAQCNDNWYSFSESHRGECSGHGGVKHYIY